MSKNGLIYSVRKRKVNSKKPNSIIQSGNILKWKYSPFDYLLFLTPPTVQQIDGDVYSGYFESAITNLGNFRLPERMDCDFPLIMIQGFITYDGELECILTDHMGEKFFVSDKDSLLLAIKTIEKATANRNVVLTDEELRSLSMRVIDNHVYRKESVIMRMAESMARTVLRCLSKPLYERRIKEEKMFFPDLSVTYTELKEERLKIDTNRKALLEKLKQVG